MKQNLFAQITDEIIAAIEAGVDELVMPWHDAAAMPVNGATGRAYNGINTLLLWVAARQAGYTSSRWATYRQWFEIGGQVRKGEASTTVVFWKAVEAKQAGEGEGDNSARFIARSFHVFNLGQVEGVEEQAPTILGDEERLADADRFFQQVPAVIWFGGNGAFYDPEADMVSMPDFAKFISAERYYGVLAHELVHWSGANHRLGRDLKNRFGSEAYAMEELIAELGAAFLGAQLGIPIQPRRDHAPYIASWLQVLRNDPRAIVTAASKAQIAVSYLLELGAPAVSDADIGAAA